MLYLYNVVGIGLSFVNSTINSGFQIQNSNGHWQNPFIYCAPPYGILYDRVLYVSCNLTPHCEFKLAPTHRQQHLTNRLTSSHEDTGKAERRRRLTDDTTIARFHRFILFSSHKINQRSMPTCKTSLWPWRRPPPIACYPQSSMATNLTPWSLGWRPFLSLMVWSMNR